MNVTPLVDIALVVLIIFVVIVPMMEKPRMLAAQPLPVIY